MRYTVNDYIVSYASWIITGLTWTTNRTSIKVCLQWIESHLFLSLFSVLIWQFCLLFFDLLFWLRLWYLQSHSFKLSLHDKNNIHILPLNLKVIWTRHETFFYMFLSLKQKSIYSEIRYAYSIFLLVRPAPIWRTSYKM